MSTASSSESSREPFRVKPSAAAVTELATLLAELTYASNIDGYGDEGAGYDYEKQARDLFASEWYLRQIGVEK